MPANYFLDTNILLYAYDLDAEGKRTTALSLLERGWTELGSTVISVQVLQEFHVNFTRKGGSTEELGKIVEDLSLWPVTDNTLELFGRGMAIRERHQLSLWDAMIVAAAQQAGTKTLFTEDLNHGQDYDGVQAVDPFK